MFYIVLCFFLFAKTCKHVIQNVTHFSPPNWGSHFLRPAAFSTVRCKAHGHWLRWTDCWMSCKPSSTQTLLTINFIYMHHDVQVVDSYCNTDIPHIFSRYFFKLNFKNIFQFLIRNLRRKQTNKRPQTSQQTNATGQNFHLTKFRPAINAAVKYHWPGHSGIVGSK